MFYVILNSILLIIYEKKVSTNINNGIFIFYVCFFHGIGCFKHLDDEQQFFFILLNYLINIRKENE
jgi:hypothetical protein